MSILSEHFGAQTPIDVELDTYYELSTNSYRVVELGENSPTMKLRSLPLPTEQEAIALAGRWRQELKVGLVPAFHIL